MNGRNTPSLPPQIANVLSSEPVWVLKVALDPAFRPGRVSEELLSVFQRAAALLKKDDPGRVRQHIEELLIQEDPSESLRWMSLSGVMEHILPEVHATLHLSQEAGRRHKDVWEHTIQVVRQTPSRPVLRWSALLHDIGKVRTRTINEKGKVQFLGHAEKGAAMFKRIGKRLAFPKDLAARIHFLVLKHLRANQYESTWTDSAVRRFYNEIGDNLDDLLDLSRADITTGRPAKKARALTMIDELAGRISRLKEEDARVPPLPSGLGNHIMARFQLPPGRTIGRMRDLLERAVENETLEPRREPEYYLDYLEEHKQAWNDSAQHEHHKKNERGPSG